MKVSNMLLPTLREDPAEAEIVSHKLMMRASMIRKLAAGVYAYLPVGLRSLRKVEQIIREEMDRAGAQELLMSALLPAEAYMASGRWDVFGSEMFRLKDRNSRDFCLGPTHEEVFTEMVKSEVRSYKQFPMTLYQIQTKYRDERRPRFGVMRSREFVMKDAYSFDIDEAGLDISYKKMYEAYCRIFDRLGLDYTVVDADSGAMGGSGSQEFMVKSEVGEDVIAYCPVCGYSANIEKAACTPDDMVIGEKGKAMEEIETPNSHTIEELTDSLGVKPYNFVKTLIYQADDKVVAAMVRGDRELNETKLKNLLGVTDLELAAPNVVREVTHAEVGFAGPVGLELEIYADLEVEKMNSLIVGANKTDYHLVNVQQDRDFKVTKYADLRVIEDGDKCPLCGKEIETFHGIEVGHIFKLGTKYSKALGLTIPERDDAPIVMGCYGIGVNRCLAAIIEQNNDENGIIWPMSVAPYQVNIVLINKDDETQSALANEIYDALRKQGVDVMLDDRDERPGVKFKDSDLIGIPVRITVGKKACDRVVEYKLRASKDFEELSAEQSIEKVLSAVKEENK